MARLDFIDWYIDLMPSIGKSMNNLPHTGLDVLYDLDLLSLENFHYSDLCLGPDFAFVMEIAAILL